MLSVRLMCEYLHKLCVHVNTKDWELLSWFTKAKGQAQFLPLVSRVDLLLTSLIKLISVS